MTTNDVATDVLHILQGGTDGESATGYMLSEMTGWSLYEVRTALQVLRDRGQAVMVNADVPGVGMGIPAEWRAA